MSPFLPIVKQDQISVQERETHARRTGEWRGWWAGTRRVAHGVSWAVGLTVWLDSIPTYVEVL
jgi:hypothetical protein